MPTVTGEPMVAPLAPSLDAASGVAPRLRQTSRDDVHRLAALPRPLRQPLPPRPPGEVQGLAARRAADLGLLRLVAPGGFAEHARGREPDPEDALPAPARAALGRGHASR